MSGPAVAFVGDSLTADGQWQEWFPEYSTHNFGVAGNTTDDLLNRLSEVVDARPDTIAMLIGTNDLAWKATAEHVVRNIETILVTVRKELPQQRILVQSVIPREREYSALIGEINRHLWQFAPTIRAMYLDLWPAMATEDGELNPLYSDDRLNLNEAGYQAWLAELRPALDAIEHQPPITRTLPVITDQFQGPDDGDIQPH